MSYDVDGNYIYEIEFQHKYGDGSKWAEEVYWLESEIIDLKFTIGINPETGEWDADQETHDKGRLAKLEANMLLKMKERREAEERLL